MSCLQHKAEVHPGDAARGRAAGRYTYNTAQAKGKGSDPSFNWDSWAISRGVSADPAWGWSLPLSANDIHRVLWNRLKTRKSCLLCMLSSLTDYNDITGAYSRSPLFLWRGRKGSSITCLSWPLKFLSSLKWAVHSKQCGWWLTGHLI